MLYSDLASQHEKITNGWGYFPLSDWNTITIRGDDRISFLHNMSTQDIRRLHPGEGCEFFLADVKGHLLAHGFLQVEKNSLRMLSAPGQSETIFNHLNKYIIREDITLADESHDWESLLLLGSDAAKKLEELSHNPEPHAISSIQQPWHSASWLRHEETKLLPEDSQRTTTPTVTKTGWLNTPCYLLQIPKPSPEQSSSLLSPAQDSETLAVRALLESSGAMACSKTTWDSLRIESKLPLWGIDFHNKNFPQEIGRNLQAISFNKGCYLGQETIARIDALGHVNQELTQIRFENSNVPDAGVNIFGDGKAIGIATSTCWSPLHNCPLGLAILRRGFNQPGSRLDSEAGIAWVMESQ